MSTEQQIQSTCSITSVITCIVVLVVVLVLVLLSWASAGIFVGGANFFRGEQMLVFLPNFSILTQNDSILTKYLTKWPNPGGRKCAPLLPPPDAHACYVNKCKLILSNGTITKESCNWIEFISVAQCHWKCGYTARGCNHQSFACHSYSLDVRLLWYQNLRPWSQAWRLRLALR